MTDVTPTARATVSLSFLGDALADPDISATVTLSGVQCCSMFRHRGGRPQRGLA